MTTSRVGLLVLLLAGCGGGGLTAPRTAPVRGTVLVKGKPAAGVRVTFHPRFDTGPVAFRPSGQTGKDGRFTLSTAGPDDGAPPGDYTVTFELMRAATDKAGLDTEADAWKGRYADLSAGKWPATVKPGDNELGPFRLD